MNLNNQQIKDNIQSEVNRLKIMARAVNRSDAHNNMSREDIQVTLKDIAENIEFELKSLGK